MYAHLVSTLVAAVLVASCAEAGVVSEIIGGTDVTTEYWQMQCSLLRQGRRRALYFTCGAVLIDDSHVLTAAHCVEQRLRRKYRVMCGTKDLNTAGEIRTLSQIIKHPDYGIGDGFSPNDIAILKLTSPMTGPNMIAIPRDPSDPAASPSVYGNCYITGWGNTQEGPVGGIPAMLQIAGVVVQSDAQCTAQWQTSYNPSVHVCVTEDGVGACSGDSGGPLVCTVGGDAVLVGLTSWGRTGCDTTYPSVYTRVAAFTTWITNNIG